MNDKNSQALEHKGNDFLSTRLFQKMFPIPYYFLSVAITVKHIVIIQVVSTFKKTMVQVNAPTSP